MAQIFISYRREDSAGYAGRLSEALERRLGHGAVFRDVDALQPGQDFVDTIAIRLRDARACLVLIGREWLDAKDKSGRRRLEEPNDYVLHEIATALRGPDMLVIPVLVEGTRMPAPDELPESIQALARRHAAALHDESWDGDVDRLVTVVRKATGGGLPFGDVRTWLQRHRLRLAGAVAAALVALLLVQNRNPQPPAQSDTAAPVVPASTSAPDAASAAVVAPTEKPTDPGPSRGTVPDSPTSGRSAPPPGAKVPSRTPSMVATNESRTVPVPEAPIASAPVARRPPVDIPAGVSGASGEAERPPTASSGGAAAAPPPANLAPPVTAAAPTVTVTAASLVKKTIADYKRAAEALDDAGVRRIWPSAPDALRNSYRNLVSQTVDLDCAEPDVSSDTATVSCREQIRSVGAGRIALPVATNTATFSLRRNGDAWEISRISRQSAR